MTKHPTIAGAEFFENTFPYSSAGHKFTGRFREVWKSYGDAHGSISIHARSHRQEMRVEALELKPDQVDDLFELVRDQQAWLLANPPEHLPRKDSPQ